MITCNSGSGSVNGVDLTVKSITVPAIVFNPGEYVCYSADEIEIDGLLGEEPWVESEWTSDFVDIEGDLKPKPLSRTRVKMLWNEECLFIAAEIEEPHIWARLRQKDTVIYMDNDFEVFIDPDGDTHCYYEIEVNSFNTTWDLLLTKPYRDNGRAISSWDMKGVRSAIRIDGTINDPSDIDLNWVLEMALPLSSLKECGNYPHEGTQWRINFSRVNWRSVIDNGCYKKDIDPATGKNYPEYNWVWSPQGVINMHYPEMWGYVQFTETMAGDGSVDFNRDPDEVLKWDLRELYYAQRKFAAENARYTANLTLLHNFGYDKSIDLPVIRLTDFGFEASVRSRHSGLYWIIDNHGRVYSQNIKK